MTRQLFSFLGNTPLLVQKQLRSMEWHSEKRLFAQTLIAAHEWLVSLVLWETDQDSAVLQANVVR